MNYSVLILVGLASWLAASSLLAADGMAATGCLDLGAMIQPVPLDYRLADPDWHIWCGAPTKGYDGRYHLFYSRWPRKAGFMAWATKSEIAYAVAEHPMGPYCHVNVALPARGDQFWDGDCTHNPNIVLKDGRYYLFYMGNHGNGQYPVHRNNQRIGVAVADNPAGPWKRLDQPIIDITPDKHSFDSLCVTNPAAVVRPDGSMLVIYKAVQYIEGEVMGGRVRYGAAIATDPLGPYTKIPGHIFEATGDTSKTWMLAEDPFIWYSDRYGRRYCAIARDVEGHFTGTPGGIALFESPDGLDWKPAARPAVLSDKIHYADGSVGKTKLERPALLLEDGVPVALFGATNGYEPHGENAFNVHIPLKR